MKSKKVLVIAMIVCLVSVMSIMTSCDNTKNQTENLSSKLKNKLEAYKTDLKDSASTMKTNDNIKSYLTSWAKSKGINYTTDDAGNVIMTKSAGSKYKDVAPTVIVCPYDQNQFENYINPVATALYTIKNNESTGKLTVIFTKESGHDFSGIQALDSKYITNDSKVFCLNGGQKGLFATKSGASSTYRFTQSVSYRSPSYTKAYKITISGLPGGQPDSKISDYVNPITKLESLLASLKSKGIGYELASIKGGNDSNLYATSATMTIVVDADKEESFKEKMEELTKDFKEKYSKDYPKINYTYKSVSTPSKVLTTSKCSKFVSYMYTLLDGEYYKDDDGNLVSITNISYIKSSGSSIKINSVAYSLDAANLAEIDNGEKTLCSLSGVKYKKTSSTPLWKGSSTSKFAKAVSTAYNTYTSSNLTYTDSITASNASYISKLNSKCSIICVTVNDNVVEDCTGTIIEYLMNSNQTDN